MSLDHKNLRVKRISVKLKTIKLKKCKMKKKRNVSTKLLTLGRTPFFIITSESKKPFCDIYDNDSLAEVLASE